MKDSILLTNGYQIKKSALKNEDLKKIQKDLTVSPFNLDQTPKEKLKAQYKVYTESDTHITIPRYYGVQNFGDPEKVMHAPDKMPFKFTGNLRDYQTPIVEKCVNHMRTKGGGLLSVPCGAGKTTMALKMASELGVKTLVVVHKTFLKDQWVARVKQFTDADVGTIRQNKVDVEGKHIVIALIQSLSRRDYSDDIFKHFGLVIYDECHHVASKMFSKALAKTGCQYTLGLSATPYRSDGLIKIMHWYVGETIYQIKLKTNNKVLAKIFTYHSTDESFKNRSRYMAGKVRPDCVKMISHLIKLKQRTKFIVKIIDRLRRDPERKILVLSGRKLDLTNMKDRVDKLLEKDIADGTIDKDEYMTCYYTGDVSAADREIAEKNADILFGTFDMAHEGLDIDRLNTIILATPKKNVVQSVGRILRKVLDAGDTRPLIVDIKDNLSVFTKHGEIRETFYTKCQYKIDYYYVKNKKIISPQEFATINGIPGDFNNKVYKFKKILKVPPIEIEECEEDNAAPIKKKGKGRSVF